MTSPTLARRRALLELPEKWRNDALRLQDTLPDDMVRTARIQELRWCADALDAAWAMAPCTKTETPI